MVVVVCLCVFVWFGAWLFACSLLVCLFVCLPMCWLAFVLVCLFGVFVCLFGCCVLFVCDCVFGGLFGCLVVVDWLVWLFCSLFVCLRFVSACLSGSLVVGVFLFCLSGCLFVFNC